MVACYTRHQAKVALAGWHSLASRIELASPKGTVAWHYYQSWCSELLAVKAKIKQPSESCEERI